MKQITETAFVDWCIENEATDTEEIITPGQPKRLKAKAFGTTLYEFEVVK